MPLSAGSRIGVYEIVAPIGVGGMGEVYRARDTKLNREVAVKVLPALFAGDGDRLDRFRREATVLAALNHPNIAHVHGFEDQAGAHALVMELVEGPTLAERIAQGPLPVSEAIAIARQIADALEAAHEKGIIHRDLKPANVKVRDDGTVKVLDFGLAKALGPEGSNSSSDVMNSPTLTARATQLGVILGTAAYMAPEQAKGKAVDKRADIWAFGVVLFEMLAGQRAFKGEDMSDVLAAVLRQDIDWKALPADLPRKVRRLLERCLEREPKKRLRDIGDAFSEIDTADEPAPAPVAPVIAPVVVRPSTLSRILPWAVALVVAGIAVAWALLRAPAPEPRLVTRARFSTKEAAAFVNLSRDGSRLAYTTVGGGSAAALTLRSMDEFDPKPLAGSDGASFPLFSPDGQWIAYSTLDSPRKIKKMPVTGGASIPICAGDFWNGGAWGDDDSIVFSGAGGLMRVPSSGGTPEPLTKLDKEKNETAHDRPQFLPGGRQLLFTIRSSRGVNFAVLDLKAGTYRELLRGGDNGRYVGSGHLTYVRDGNLFAVPFDLAKLAATGNEVPLIEGVSTDGTPNTGDYTVSDAGLLVYLSVEANQQGTTLAWIDRKGTVQPLTGLARQVWGTGRLSPNGRYVANGIKNDKGTDIWVFDIERGTPTRLTFDGNGDSPIWMPDGRHVLYPTTLNGKSAVASVAIDGAGKPELVMASDEPATPTSVSADGKTLLFDRGGKDKTRQVFVLPLGGSGEARPLHAAVSTEAQAQFSPDGKWVAYLSLESGKAEVYVTPFPASGAKTRVSIDGGNRPRWSADGRQLVFWANSPGSKLMSADFKDGIPGPPQLIFDHLSGTTWDVTPKPDRFLIELTGNGTGATIATVTNWFEELRRRAPSKK